MLVAMRDGTVNVLRPSATRGDTFDVAAAALVNTDRGAVRGACWLGNDGGLVALATDAMSLVILSGDTLAEVTRVAGAHDDYIRSVRADSSGRRLVSASDDLTAKVWTLSGDGDAVAVHEELALTGHRHYVMSAAFAPDDDNSVATASLDRTAKLWNTADGSCTMTLKGHTAGLNALAFSRDGQAIATAADDGTVRIYSLRDGLGGVPAGECCMVLRGHTHNVDSLQFGVEDATGRFAQTIVAGSEDGRICVWHNVMPASPHDSESHEAVVAANDTAAPEAQPMKSMSPAFCLRVGAAQTWAEGGTAAAGMVTDAAIESVRRAVLNATGDEALANIVSSATPETFEAVVRNEAKLEEVVPDPSQREIIRSAVLEAIAAHCSSVSDDVADLVHRTSSVETVLSEDDHGGPLWGRVWAVFVSAVNADDGNTALRIVAGTDSGTLQVDSVEAARGAAGSGTLELSPADDGSEIAEAHASGDAAGSSGGAGGSVPATAASSAALSML